MLQLLGSSHASKQQSCSKHVGSGHKEPSQEARSRTFHQSRPSQPKHSSNTLEGCGHHVLSGDAVVTMTTTQTLLGDRGLGTSGPRSTQRGSGQPTRRTPPNFLAYFGVADSMKLAASASPQVCLCFFYVAAGAGTLVDDALQSHVALEEHWGPFR